MGRNEIRQNGKKTRVTVDRQGGEPSQKLDRDVHKNISLKGKKKMRDSSTFVRREGLNKVANKGEAENVHGARIQRSESDEREGKPSRGLLQKRCRETAFVSEKRIRGVKFV